MFASFVMKLQETVLTWAWNCLSISCRINFELPTIEGQGYVWKIIVIPKHLLKKTPQIVWWKNLGSIKENYSWEKREQRP